jgi:hypothetical protein
MAGYSGTPLIRKLGIRPGARLAFVDAPADFAQLLGELPAEVRFARSGALDCAILFVVAASVLERKFTLLARRVVPSGMLWVCWPKKAAKTASDLDENGVRRIGLNSGMVDVKVCAVDETWSGLKFVYRLKDRPPKSNT